MPDSLSPRPPSEKHTLPAVHLLHLLELVKRWHVEDRDLLAGFDLHREELIDPQRSLPVEACVALLERARTLTGEPALGIYLGLQMRASAHGYVGFAAMTASRLSEAIGLMFRYAPIRTTAVTIRGRAEGTMGMLVVEENADFGTARDFFLFALLIGFWQTACALTGRDLKPTMDLMIPEPPYFARFAHVLPPTAFNRPSNHLAEGLHAIDSPIAMADAASLALARDQCDRLLGSLGLDGRLVGRVRRVLSREDGGFRSFEDAARKVGLSPRTLRRRLAEEGLSFASLLHAERKERALLLLRSRQMSVEDVAERLGYANTANFTRAFRQWTGTTPAAYRREG